MMALKASDARDKDALFSGLRAHRQGVRELPSALLVSERQEGSGGGRPQPQEPQLISDAGSYFGRSLSILMSGSAGGAARVVVNPIQRPRKMMPIQRSSDTAATVCPAGGAALSVSQR